MQYGDEPKEKLNRLEKKLYSRNTPNVIGEERSQLSNKERVVDSGWEDLKKNNFDNLVSKFSQTAQKKQNVVRKIFIASLAFFIIAVGIATFVFLGGMNLVSSRNVDIRVAGPISIGGGQEVSLDLNIVNNNNVSLESATLSVEYPEGTRSPSDLSVALEREKFDLGTIEKGKSYSQNIKAVFFGEKESIKEVKISIEYRVENSSALFYKEKVYELSISSSPVIVTPTYPKEVNSNQDMSFDIEVASNSKDRIKDFLVTVEYPFGFVFSSASPAPSFGNNVWKFSNLNSGEKNKISIKGNIIGQDNEERVFRVSAGTANVDDERQIGVPFSESVESILVKKPFINLNVYVGGENKDFVTRGGNSVNTEIALKNNLPSRLFNTTVEVSLQGGAFNRLSVAPDKGFFQSINDTILWDKRSVNSLSDMAPGSEQRLTFSLTPLSYSSVPEGTKPEVNMTITTRGERVLESGRVEEVVAVEKRKITLSTDLVLTSRALRSIGNIENSGPIPPKVNSKTTYTVLWRIENTFNQVSNAEVRATLPPYVKWTGISQPGSESITYNETTKEVVWNAGAVLPYTGINASPKEVYFQLEILPSTSQIGQNPQILGEATLSGIDKVVGLRIQSNAPSLSTIFDSDPTFRDRDGVVGQ